MMNTATKIASGLERAFVTHGFAKPNVDVLRDAAGVSLRTLYKYAPSRSDMVLAALEHRHNRYIEKIFSDLPPAGKGALTEVLTRIADWMSVEAERGCLFHAAVAANPTDEQLKSLLKRHKADVGSRATHAASLPGMETEITVIIEGLTQAWPMFGDAASQSARNLVERLYD